jgi:hypothetical protein
MKFDTAPAISPGLEFERIELFMPEPIEAWTLADFTAFELDCVDDECNDSSVYRRHRGVSDGR